MSGISYPSNVTHFNTAKAAATVVDAQLDSTTFISRMLGMGRKFDKSTLKKTIKVTSRSQGQWVSGAEALNSAVENVTVQLEFNPTFYTAPVADVLTYAFSREDDEDINYDGFLYEDALDETIQDLSSAGYGMAAGDQPEGLESIVDNGTNAATYGGQSRSTYSNFNSTVTASSGTLALSKMGTMVSTIGDTDNKEKPTSIITTTTVVDLFEQLLNPTVRHEQQFLPVRGRRPMASNEAVGINAGWNVYSFRTIPILSDKQCTSGAMYFLNENYLHWYGKTKAPKRWSNILKPVKLGKMVKESYPGDRPSDYHGMFYQEDQAMPNQGAIIGRIWAVGNLVSFNPRRHGKLTGITGI